MRQQQISARPTASWHCDIIQTEEGTKNISNRLPTLSRFSATKLSEQSTTGRPNNKMGCSRTSLAIMATSRGIPYSSPEPGPRVPKTRPYSRYQSNLGISTMASPSDSKSRAMFSVTSALGAVSLDVGVARANPRRICVSAQKKQGVTFVVSVGVKGFVWWRASWALE